MSKRLVWLLVSLILPLFALLALAVRFSPAQSLEPAAALHDVIFNEWSQGSGGSREWVELLVVNGPLDLRGWSLDDANSPGMVTFAEDPFWSSVPSGSLIVIYNGGDRDTILPPDDLDLSDCTAVIPHNDTTYFSGGWPAFSNTEAADNPHLRDAANTTIHDFSAEPGGNSHPSANQNAQFEGISADTVSDSSLWHNNPATTASPGVGNGSANTAWIHTLCTGSTPPGEPDLQLAKAGPATAAAGSNIIYQISLSNAGQHVATDVVLTDTLPTGLAYVSDDSGYPLSQPFPDTLVWTVGAVPTATTHSFYLTATIAETLLGPVTNQISATTRYTESNTANNHASATTVIYSEYISPVVIEAILYDGYETGDTDEAVALRHLGSEPADLSGWKLSDGSPTTAVLPEGTLLAPGQIVWITRNSAAFQRQFGFTPDIVTTAWPGFANTGDELLLLNPDGVVVDTLVYKNGDTAQNGWSGVAVQPYRVSGVFAEEGQILYRRRDQATGLPVPDTNTANDWAQTQADVINGRKVRYPGWDLDTFFFTRQITTTAVLTIAIAPDNAYEAIVRQLNAAHSHIQIETLTFENLAIANALVNAANRGVAVTVLLEGSPPGGLPDQEKYICQQLETAGGQCWFSVSEATAQIYDRYRFVHAKFILIDGLRIIISSENLSPNSLPDDDKSDGTWGRRGVVLITDATEVVSHMQQVFALDFDTANHLDLFRWQADHPIYGEPAPGFIPITQTGGITYSVRYPMPTTLTGVFAFEIVQSPENSLRDQDGLLGLVNQVGTGDVVLVQQLSERPYWGVTASNPTDDPNPRLEAYINAARRGATVRLLLDDFFDDTSSPVSNWATCHYVNEIARQERLALACARHNPAGLGIHNKMVLVQVNGRGYVHVGSINGTEQANKGNREVALQVQSDAAYALLLQMFNQDWPHYVYSPIVLNGYIGPADHPLISEVLYNPGGSDDAEFIELANPTSFLIDLSFYSLGDAVNREDFEDVRRFPAGTLLAPGATLVVATTATAFRATYGLNPHFEVVDTDPIVPDLIDDPTWGDPATFLQLGNNGDEVILRDAADQIVDVVTYGTGAYPGFIACPLVSTSNHSLERFPYWRTTGNCAADFRAWPFPNPGLLPMGRGAPSTASE